MKRLITVLFIMLFSYSWAQEPWLYENTYNHGFQILESYDGGVIISATEEGQDNLPKVFKLNQSGDLLWEHTFIDNSIIMPACMLEDSQGNIVVAGMTQHYDVGLADGFILKLNPCGEVVWFEVLSDSGIYNYIKAMIVDKDDNIIVAEFNGDTNNWEYFEATNLKKYNSDGQLQWSSVLLPENQSDPKRIVSCSDGGYLISANFYRPPYYDLDLNVYYVRATHVKTDSLGNVQWVHVFRWEDDTPEAIHSSVEGFAVEIEPNQFIALASDYGTDVLTPYLYKINTEGVTVWEKDVSETNKVYGSRRLVLDKDSNLILGINVANTDFENKHLEIHKYDSLGNNVN